MTDTYLTNIQNNADLSVATKKHYIDKINLIQKLMNQDISWIIHHPNETHTRIEVTYDEASKKASLFTCILAIFRNTPDLIQSESKNYKLYREFHDENFNIANEKYRSGIPSDKQKLGYVNWPSIIKKRDELAASNFGSKEHLLLSIYTYIPPVRQDFNNVPFLTKFPPNVNEGNYIVLSTTSYLVLNEHKTSKHNKLKTVLDKELVDVIRKSLALYPIEIIYSLIQMDFLMTKKIVLLKVSIDFSMRFLENL